MSDLDDIIIDKAGKAKTIETDGVRVDQHPLDSLKALKKLDDANNAVAGITNGTAFFGGFRMISPGARGGGNDC